MIAVDIADDLNAQDQKGLVWRSSMRRRAFDLASGTPHFGRTPGWGCVRCPFDVRSPAHDGSARIIGRGRPAVRSTWPPGSASASSESWRLPEFGCLSRVVGAVSGRTTTGQPIDRRDAYRMVARIAKVAGIPRHINPRSLRHAAIPTRSTSASLCATHRSWPATLTRAPSSITIAPAATSTATACTSSPPTWPGCK